ncbi:unnamed protein product [Amoebophrya sp. A120]|nr:unnamed protein product [Amoebophrya sp. A120]|eukprot:GSA120T00026344001.1
MFLWYPHDNDPLFFPAVYLYALHLPLIESTRVSIELFRDHYVFSRFGRSLTQHEDDFVEFSVLPTIKYPQ